MEINRSQSIKRAGKVQILPVDNKTATNSVALKQRRAVLRNQRVNVGIVLVGQPPLWLPNYLIMVAQISPGCPS